VITVWVAGELTTRTSERPKAPSVTCPTTMPVPVAGKISRSARLARLARISTGSKPRMKPAFSAITV